MTESEPTMGMGMDGPSLQHVAVLAECNEMVLMTHMITDHELTDETMLKELESAGTLIMLHMQLHGHVIQVSNE